jgi:hypothetical protein
MWQTSKTCWSGMQDLLLRPASFAARFFARNSARSTSATCCIPKAFLLRDIPTPCLIGDLITLIFFNSFQSRRFERSDLDAQNSTGKDQSHGFGEATKKKVPD